MTFHRGEMGYDQYLKELYSDLGLLLTLIKSFDGLENAKSIPSGLDKAAFESHKEKAKLHTHMWKKLNRDVYLYMLKTLHSKGIDASGFAHTSFSQALANQVGVRVVRVREAASGEVIMSLPDEASNVITVYAPYPPDLFKNPKLANTITLEYSSVFLPQDVFLRLLQSHFGPNTKIDEMYSMLPPLLRNRHSYFYEITNPSGFDEEAHTAFFRHLHKLSLFYPKYFLNSPDRFEKAVLLYDKLWHKWFYPHPTSQQ